MSPLRATLACGAFVLPSSGLWTPYARTPQPLSSLTGIAQGSAGNGPRLLPLWPTLSSTVLAARTPHLRPACTYPPFGHCLAKACTPPAPPALRTPCARLPGAGQSARPGLRHWVLSGHSLSLSQSASPAPP